MGRQLKQITPRHWTLEERFWWNTAHIGAGADDCWPWTGNTFGKNGEYGRIFWRGKYHPSHRVGYGFLVGPIPAGLSLDHLCRNTLCGNPRHLEPVTNRENWLRGEAPSKANALKTNCPNGHPYDTFETGRRCSTCRREVGRRSSLRYAAKRRVAS